MQRPNAIEVPFKAAYELLNLYRAACQHALVGNCSLNSNVETVLGDLNQRSTVLINPDLLRSLLYHAEQLSAEKGPVKIVTDPSPTNFYSLMNSLLMQAPQNYSINTRTKEIRLKEFTRKGAKKELEEKKAELAKKKAKDLADRQHREVMLNLLEKVLDAPKKVGDINNESDGQADNGIS